MGKCSICKLPLVDVDDIDFIEFTPRNALGEMTSGLAVHKQCKKKEFEDNNEV